MRQSIPQIDGKLSLVMVSLNHMRIHTFCLWTLAIPTYSETWFALEQNLCCICKVLGWLLQNSLTKCICWRCGTNSCTDWRWYGYNCCYCNVWCTKAWEVPVWAVRHLLLMIVCLSVTSRICSSTHTLCKECKCRTSHHIPCNVLVTLS